MRAVMVCLIEAKVFSEAEQKSVRALTQPGESGRPARARSSMIAGKRVRGAPAVSWRKISPRVKGRAGVSAT
jgi:hypothetical protein